MTQKPVAASPTNSSTGFSACDKHGREWPVDEATARQIEHDRKARNANAGKSETPGTDWSG